MVTKMMIETNVIYRKLPVDAKGFHDPIGKCLILKAGSMGMLCENPRKTFFGQPDLQKLYESEILPQTSSAGNDSHYYLQKDVRCYPTDNYDELSVGASLISGVLTKGKSVWKDLDGKSLNKKEEFAPGDGVIYSTEEITRFDDAAQKMYDMAFANRSRMIDILSLAFHLKSALGTKNEDRFVVPRQVDHCIATFGLLCEEEEAYDLRIPEPDYTISDKMANDLFHHSTSKKVRTETIKECLQMSNTRSGQSSDNHKRPQFDSLLVMQYIPYLVCGVVPYYKIVTHFRHTDGGWVLRKVPTDYFKYVISPTESVQARDITPEIQAGIDDFARLVKGDFLPKLLDKMPKIVDTPLPIHETW